MKEIRYTTPDKRAGRILCEELSVDNLVERINYIGGSVTSIKGINQFRTLVRK